MKSSKLIMGCLATLGLAIAAASSAQADADYDAIAERIKPVGQVCLQGDDCGTSLADSAPAADSGGGIDGEGIYGRVCAACHESGAAGAPIRGSEDDWASRIDQGIETLYTHSIEGFGAMPARGGNPNLSDEEVMAATNHLLDPVMDDLPEIGGANGEEEAANGEDDAANGDEAEVAEASDDANGNGDDAAADGGNGLDGEALYASGGCVACHGSGVAGAPALGDADAWSERIEKGIDELYANSINGIGAMPPKGGNMSLDDEEVQAIVDYMIAEAE